MEHRNRIIPLMHAAAALVVLALADPARALAPDWFLAQLDATSDSPREAEIQARRLVGQASSPSERYWALLMYSHAALTQEHVAEAQHAVTQAREALDTWGGASEEDRAWLEIADVRSVSLERDATADLERLLVFRSRHRFADFSPVDCELSYIILWHMQQADHDEDGWREAERLIRCGDLQHRPNLKATALSTMATLRWRGGDNGTDELYQQALQATQGQSLRYRRSVILWDQGRRLLDGANFAAAARSLQQALELSRELKDDGGVVDTAVLLGNASLEAGDRAAALRAADEGWRAVGRMGDEGHRLEIATVRLRVAAALHAPDVPDWIARVQRLVPTHEDMESRGDADLALGEGFAAIGQYQTAYESVLRARKELASTQLSARDRRVAALQQRYDKERQAAESERLRLEGLARQADVDATHRVMWVLVAAASLVLSVGALWASQLARRRREAAELALRDELTGQPNRRAILGYAEQMLRDARQGGRSLSLAILDLDHFKGINDQYGHAVGDAVLCSLAQIARDGLRGGDRLGRIGGEEWLLVMPGAEHEHAGEIFDRLRERFRQTPVDGLPHPHPCTFSMGAAELGADGTDLVALMSVADQRLYLAKNQGRDRLVGA